MGRLWRLTRNRYGRRAYEVLGRAGITATYMYEYGRELDGLDSPPTDAGPDTAVVSDPDVLAPLDAPVAELRADESVVCAFLDGVPVGYLFLSVDTDHDIEPLERTMAFDGAYIRRVFVAPDYRNRGVATSLVSTACDLAVDDGADRATALVALDNVPSRSLFSRRGFEPRRVWWYVRVGPFSHRSSRPA